jgi:hypothetical protein
MNRKELRKQWALHKRAEKAFEEADQFAKEWFESWLKEGGRSREEFRQECEELKQGIVELVRHQQTPVGLFRFVLVEMVAVSLANQATDLDQLGKDAALFGHVLVECALQTFAENSPTH